MAFAACLAVFDVTQASAEELFAPETLSASIDLRMVAVDGEKSWVRDGFGKLRWGATGDGYRLRPHAVEGALIWQPRFTWSLSGTAVVAAQQGQEHAVDLQEAFVTWKPLAGGSMRVSARAGLFWPPLSLEHQGAAWAVADTVSPSAINSWIGEEVKVVGAEATLSRRLGEHEISATAAIFGFNDTAGTLLAFRGWALHDLKATAFGKHPLPPLNAFMTRAQAPDTRPVIELDNRPGFYGRLLWRPPAPFTLQVLHYDNRGDPTAVRRGQWGWETRFTNIGAQLDLGERTKLLGQAMEGTTKMGFPSAGVYWVETRYRSAFLLASRKIGEGGLSARVDLFDTRNHGTRLNRDDDEKGWSLTGAWRTPLFDRAMLVIEAMHVASDRRARGRSALRPNQHQTALQAALRLAL